MNVLVVEVVANGVVIGIADLKSCDPGMGVASGVFHPNEAYSLMVHARVSEDIELDVPPADLTARQLSGAVISCAGCDLIDFYQTVGDEGREFTVLGMDDFEAFFNPNN